MPRIAKIKHGREKMKRCDFWKEIGIKTDLYSVCCVNKIFGSLALAKNFLKKNMITHYAHAYGLTLEDLAYLLRYGRRSCFLERSIEKKRVCSVNFGHCRLFKTLGGKIYFCFHNYASDEHPYGDDLTKKEIEKFSHVFGMDVTPMQYSWYFPGRTRGYVVTARRFHEEIRIPEVNPLMF